MATELLTIIRQNLQNLETEELIEIWKEFDLEAWRPEALDFVKEILLERLGDLPEQNLNVRYQKITSTSLQLISVDDLSAAFKECEEALKLDPNRADAYYLRGMIFQKLNKPDEALADFRRCASLDFINLDNQKKLQDLIEELEWQLWNEFEESEVKQHLDAAWELMFDQDEVAALHELDLADHDFPTLSEAWNYKGMILEGLDRLDEAIECYLEAVRLDPCFWNGRENLGNARKKFIDELYRLPPQQFIDEESGEIVILPNLADESLFSTAEVERQLPGWFTLDETAWLVRGTPGHRNRPGRCGYDPMDYYADEGRFIGLLIRKLFTGRLRTHNPIYLLLLLVVGGLSSLAFFVFLTTDLADRDFLVLILYCPYWLPGLACIYNFCVSLVSKKPVFEQENGSSFF